MFLEKEKMPTIKFMDTSGEVPEIYYPRPSKFFIPEWIKSLEPYYDKKGIDQTAKRCLPMLDAVMSGYSILTSNDIRVSRFDDGSPFYEWSSGSGLEWHTKKQVSTHKKVTDDGVPKILNPWAIETPKGYSCLFTSPFNQDSPIVVPFTGIVDTDRFKAPVNFPFILSDPEFEGVIDAGTPIVQVFPFKRDGWKIETVAKSNGEPEKTTAIRFSRFKNAYRDLFHVKKEYR